MNRFASTVLYVADDVKPVLDFYVAAFGLTIKHFDSEFNFGELDTGEATIAIAGHEAGKYMVGEGYRSEADGNPKNVELAFYADDVVQSYKTAVDKGCIGLCEPKATPWGQTVAYVRTIEGTLVGLVSGPGEA